MIWSSKDDPTVPYQHSVRIQSQIAGSQLRMFEDRGHFNQEEFPELVEEIRKKQRRKVRFLPSKLEKSTAIPL